MILEEFHNYRTELLEQSKDDEGFIQESLLLSEVLPSMLDAKLIDSEDFNNSYFKSTSDKLKINAYSINDSGERLQLFVVNENSIDLSGKESELQISTKSSYEDEFKRCTKFINKALKGHLDVEIQDSSPARPLISKMSSSEGADQFDVIEIFLISATSTVSLQTANPQPKRIDFEDEELKISFQKNQEKSYKSLIIKKRLIDLNFLHNILISQGKREALLVDFKKLTGSPLLAIKAADEKHFESYLCVFPAKTIASLYKDFSTRLLEKNVRSFLQFRGVNKGIRETIRKEPEKFVAYNNGLTITATAGEVTDNGGSYEISSLKDFQIVNGGQTTSSIYFTNKDGFDISKVKVMAKINIAKESSEDELEELISNISTFSNAQSRVSKVDLRSRTPQLIKIKSLSESVVTPSGRKWFFERAKGEFNTKKRIAGPNKKRLEKEYPSERRFSKELMAKYYTAWGDQPYLVKKGGEKVFRYFIEKLTGETITSKSNKKPLNIDREFYEELVAKIILFRKMEKLYGSGKNSMGQLRSAAVPYSLAVIYAFTDGSKRNNAFDLSKIWKMEEIENNLKVFLNKLLELINSLIKKYAQSDDFGEYSKKEQLWIDIKTSKEVEDFMTSDFSKAVLSEYSISKEELVKRKKEKKSKYQEIDFTFLLKSSEIFDKGNDYYSKIELKLGDELSVLDKRKISLVRSAIQNKRDLDQEILDYHEDLFFNLRKKHPNIFDITPNETSTYEETSKYIIEKYNYILANEKDIYSEFEKIALITEHKQIKFASVWKEIGKGLIKGSAPTMKQLSMASQYVESLNKQL